MTATLTADKFEAAAEILSLSADFRVLRRFVPRDRYIDTVPDRAKIGVFVDVETTGLDKETAEIIELGMVPFYFDPDRAQILQVITERLYFAFEEPKGDVSAEITQITGIEPADLIGQRIDDARVNSILGDAALVIAHNAEYDRPILERRLSGFAAKHWACSQREVKWDAYGAVGAKLGNILAGVCGEFYEAHRALDDCRVGVHVLAHQRPCEACHGTGVFFDDVGTAAERERPCADCVDGTRSPFSELLHSARLATLRIYAIDSAFPAKEKLKARKYRWSDGTHGPKSWFKDVKTDAELDEERMYLQDIIGVRSPLVTRITAKDRFSARVP
jgi:DNA polymerase-3 subunit epsilon